jgi:citrate lyase gamma subunit
MKTIEEQIESAARMMAAAYWRGRLENIRVSVLDQGAIEVMIKAAAEHDLGLWKAAARIAVV